MTKPRTSTLIRDFSHAFGRPVNVKPVDLTVTERELLGKLIFEECLEYLTKGLGLQIGISDDHAFDVHTVATEGGSTSLFTFPTDEEGRVITGSAWSSIFHICLNEGQPYDPLESIDGLADMNVVIHFNSNWHGFDLDEATEIVHESNMSKLDENGKPIINECRHYGGDKTPAYVITEQPVNIFLCHNREEGVECHNPEHLVDPTRPAGKILKGPNYWAPTEKLKALLDSANG